MTLAGRHFLSTGDFTRPEVESLLDLAIAIKSGKARPRLTGKVLAMVFLNPSLRTRVSFQLAMTQLGGTAIALNAGSDSWRLELGEGTVMDGDTQEHVKDAARVLGRYADVLAVRAFATGKDWDVDRRDLVLQAFARHSGVPVVNMESSLHHPCQAMADVLTMRERWRRLGARRLLVTWAWHPRALPMAVPHSICLLAAQMGMDLVIARPAGFDLSSDVMKAIRAHAKAAGGRVTVTSDRDGAYEGAHAVYAKAWGSLRHYGDPTAERAAKGDLRGWLVDERRMAGTADAVFLHCLPVRRNVEVTDAVLDGPRSEVYREAENRLHVQKAILASILGVGA